MNKNFLLKKIFFFSIIVLFIFPFFTFAEEENIEIKIFYSKTCPHCHDEMVFLEKLEKKYCDINVQSFLVNDNEELLNNLYKQYEVPEEINGFPVYGATPITFIRDRYFLGFRNEETTGREIEAYINESKGEQCATTSENEEESISFLGFNLSFDKTPPLLLAIVLGVLDGFNACAMVALAFLLTMLISTGTRKNLVLIGGTFILVSGLVYYFFTAAWLNLFLISKNLTIITNVVGAIVLIFASFLLRDYFKGIVCRICRINPGKENILTKTQRKYFSKLKKLTKSNLSLPIMLLGVALIAVGINSIELVCSFGFPLVFTRLLTSFNLSAFSYYFYIFIYILFYMIDDFVIFLFAVFTLKITSISEKYLKAVKLISGIVLIILGLIMLFKPEFLSLF
jgi:thiol-disulfide isomerase/thioredoxin